ncbi:MAG TPA: leucine-rich repeat domain-containing protein [Candidatus Deferrimicrobium sp.]|nr:leucine-rich repeat domain-containing protein [Candidatus Deferrimicrobium sp.]
MEKIIANRCLTKTAVVAAVVFSLFGCSDQSLNDRPASTIAIEMDIAGSQVAVDISTFTLDVTGPNMDPIHDTLRLEGRYLVGEVSVPSGQDRHFVVLALDAAGDTIYRGDVIVDVPPSGSSEPLVLNITLVPQVPMIKISPRFDSVIGGEPFVLEVRVFNVDSLYWANLQISYVPSLVSADSLVRGPSLDTSYQFTEAILPRLGLIFLSVQDITEAHRMLVNDDGDVVLARIFCTAAYPDIEFDSSIFSLRVLALEKGQNEDTIPLASVYTDNAEVELVLPDSVVAIPDPYLRQAVRDALQKPVGPIYRSEVLTIDTLFASEAGIVDLTGLSALTNLDFLELDYNGIVNLSAISSLDSLDALFLSTNQITDLSPLAGLTNLQILDVSFNQITNLSSLTGLYNLQTLLLQYNQITDITPLVDNFGIDTGDYINLSCNPLSSASKDMVGTLRLRAVTVDDSPCPAASPTAEAEPVHSRARR